MSPRVRRPQRGTRAHNNSRSVAGRERRLTLASCLLSRVAADALGSLGRGFGAPALELQLAAAISQQERRTCGYANSVEVPSNLTRPTGAVLANARRPAVASMNGASGQTVHMLSHSKPADKANSRSVSMRAGDIQPDLHAGMLRASKCSTRSQLGGQHRQMTGGPRAVCTRGEDAPHRMCLHIAGWKGRWQQQHRNGCHLAPHLPAQLLAGTTVDMPPMQTRGLP